MSNNTVLPNTADWRATRFGLSRIAALLEKAGNPQDGMRFVHITGTNGKGSTASFVAKVLQKAGYKTGLYTSPHLQRFTERIKVNGVEIPTEEAEKITSTLWSWAEKMPDRPTEFEFYTALAMIWYAQQGCDVVVLEVGMGGEYDATNIVKNTDAAVFTNIGLDHTKYLGDNILDIAKTKSGILKPNCAAVIYDQSHEVVDLIFAEAQKLGCSVAVPDFSAITPISEDLFGQSFSYGNRQIQISLLGEHQRKNAVLALTVCEQLILKGYKISEENILEGLAETVWPARFEVLSRKPLFIVDGGHNPQCAEALAQSVKSLLKDKNIIMLFGMLEDKDYTSTLRLLLPLADRFIVAAPNSERALSAKRMAEKLAEEGIDAVSYDDIPSAVDAAMNSCGENDAVVCFGSLYLAGDVRTCFGL